LSWPKGVSYPWPTGVSLTRAEGINLRVFSTLFSTMHFCNSLLAQTNSWYSSKELGVKTWIIKEPGFDENMYLLEGQDSSLLIDAGFGMGNLRDFVKSLTSKPLIIVNTHFHPDHTGGDYEFPFVCIGAKDMEYAKPFLNPKVVQQITSQMLRDTTIADSLKFPESQVQRTILIPVNDNYVFKLGDRNVQVINVPGHTPEAYFCSTLRIKLSIPEITCRQRGFSSKNHFQLELICRASKN
jgi:hypothetical protein